MTYLYEVIPGNNHQLIKSVINKSFRNKYWKDVKNPVENTGSTIANNATSATIESSKTKYISQNLNFRWAPVSHKVDFEKIESKKSKKEITPFRQTQLGQSEKRFDQPFLSNLFNKGNKLTFLINHLECHKEISRKNELLSNLKTQLMHNNENIFDYMPVSFQIMIPEGKYTNLNNFLAKFNHCYEILSNSKGLFKKGTQVETFDAIQKRMLKESLKEGSHLFKTTNQRDSVRLIFPVSHFIGGNYWVIKTTNQNRGIGIHVFKTLD